MTYDPHAATTRLVVNDDMPVSARTYPGENGDELAIDLGSTLTIQGTFDDLTNLAALIAGQVAIQRQAASEPAPDPRLVEVLAACGLQWPGRLATEDVAL
jgi:hypothetical protein